MKVNMAKNTFFIRAEVTTATGGAYAQTSIDLGAFVDVLGKAVLRIHNIESAYRRSDTPGLPFTFAGLGANLTGSVGFQVTTQSQTALVGIPDKSVIASGNAMARMDTVPALDWISTTLDVGPQHWTEGYLVGVEQIFLGADPNFVPAAPAECTVEVVLECSSEKLTAGAAQALALSQQ
jgi:hypothetical protein